MQEKLLEVKIRLKSTPSPPLPPPPPEVIQLHVFPVLNSAEYDIFSANKYENAKQ